MGTYYIVGYRYFRNETHAPVRSHVMVLADSEHDAAEAFLATHKAPEGARYEVAYVTHPDA